MNPICSVKFKMSLWFQSYAVAKLSMTESSLNPAYANIEIEWVLIFSYYMVLVIGWFLCITWTWTWNLTSIHSSPCRPNIQPWPRSPYVTSARIGRTPLLSKVQTVTFMANMWFFGQRWEKNGVLREDQQLFLFQLFKDLFFTEKALKCELHVSPLFWFLWAPLFVSHIE